MFRYVIADVGRILVTLWVFLYQKVYLGHTQTERNRDMYNGIGLTTARGSGTNGYVQRNVAMVRKHKEKLDYKTEDDLKKMDDLSQKKANAEILAHAQKRKLEVKCEELKQMMENQGYSEKEIEEKVTNFRRLLLDKEIAVGPKEDKTTGSVTETHRLAAMTERKNAQIREALGISDDYQRGSSFMERKQREQQAQTMAQKKYSFIKEPPVVIPAQEEPPEATTKPKRKSRKSRSRSRSASPPRKEKKKKSRKSKHEKSDKKERTSSKRHHDSDVEDDSKISQDEDQRKQRKKLKHKRSLPLSDEGSEQEEDTGRHHNNTSSRKHKEKRHKKKKRTPSECSEDRSSSGDNRKQSRY